jgi:CheY-like chemotaxis protein
MSMPDDLDYPPATSAHGSDVAVGAVLLIAGWVVASALFALGASAGVEGSGTGGEWNTLVAAALLICALQLAGLGLCRRQNRCLAEAAQRLGDAAEAARREAELAAAQTRIVEEVYGCRRLKAALTALFRHLVPSPRDGFAAYVEIRNDTTRIRAAWGLSLPPGWDVVLDRSLLRRLENAELPYLTADALRGTGFASTLSSDDRRKVRGVYLFAVGDAEAPAGVIVTTRLFADVDRSAESMPPAAALRVLRECGRHLRTLLEREELAADAESRTALRNLVQPAESEFAETDTELQGDIVLAGLREVLSVDRVSAFLIESFQPDPDVVTPLFRSGVSVQPAVERIWSGHEAVLLSQAGYEAYGHRNSASLRELGIDSLIGGAAVAVIAVSGSRRAALVLSRRGHWQPTARDERLIVGCCELLGMAVAPDAAVGGLLQFDAAFDSFGFATQDQPGTAGEGFAMSRSVYLIDDHPVTPNEVAQLIESPSWGKLPASAPKLAASATRHLPFRVLLAEDTAVSQYVTAQLLEQAGMDVTVVADGRKAVDAALGEPFDLVLMDVQMPELDGVAASEEIRRRERGRRTPIVAMTARTREEDRARCRHAGMDGFLTKPLTPEQLEETLRDLPSRGGRGCSDAKPRLSRSPGLPCGPVPATQASPRVPEKSNRATAIGVKVENVLGDVEDLFRATCADSVQAIKRAAATGDAAALENSAHSLKGAASCLGEDRLAELLYELERMGAECRLENARPVLQLLDAEIDRYLG